MKLYNQNTNRVVTTKTVTTDKGIFYVNKLTDEQLNTLGYYKLKYENQPSRRYYTSEVTTAIVNGVYTTSYRAVDKEISTVKAAMIKDLFETAEILLDTAEIDTTLGFKVKAARKDLDTYERGSKRNVLDVRDVNFKKYTITKQELDSIVNAVETNGILLLQTKGIKFDEIDAFTTVAECILYEATPYEVEEEIIDEMGEPTGEGTHTVTRYKNNVKEW